MAHMQSIKVVLRAVCILALAAVGYADDFRVESKVFVGKEKEPVVQSLTLFKSGFVYDFLSEPAHVAIYDRVQARFVLLDQVNKIRTEVKGSDIVAFTDQIKNMAGISKNQLVQFHANPKFEVRYQYGNPEMVLHSSQLTYHIDTVEAPSSAAAQQYREFSDWFARLNVMIDPQAMPPFARMAVNQELATRDLLPKVVRLEQGGEALRSQHDITWRLSRHDDELIAGIGNQIAMFRVVSFNDFRAGGKSAVQAASATSPVKK
jgi:hypothetical protein